MTQSNEFIYYHNVHIYKHEMEISYKAKLTFPLIFSFLLSVLFFVFSPSDTFKLISFYFFKC